MSRITHKMVELRVSRLSEMTGHGYIVDFNPYYGGWNMQVACNEHGGLCDGDFGFCDRKSTREFFNYLNGILAGLWYCERQKSK